MSTLASTATGNLTAAGTWDLCDPTAALDSEAGSTALTVATQDSSAFVPAAVAIKAVMIKLASRAASPTGTITVALLNSTTSTVALTLTINIADLDSCATGTDQSGGGWYKFVFGSTVTPNGTDSYKIRVNVSATTCAVSLWTNGTTANWAREVVNTTTQAPVAGDKLIVAGDWTGAGALTSYTVTMNSTAATNYGDGVTGATGTTRPGLAVCKGGTLSFGTTASTNYILQLNGSLVVYSSGTLNIGTSGTPVPSTSTAVLQFNPGTSLDYGLTVHDNGTLNVYGVARTSGKNKVWTLLTSDVAGGGTSANVADDTGWLSGDSIAIASTDLTQSHCEVVALTGNATSSALAFGATAQAHKGSTTEPCQAEVILLTRNVSIISVTSSKYWFMRTQRSSTISLSWALFRYMDNWYIENTTGVVTGSYCVGREIATCFQNFDNPLGISCSSVSLTHMTSFKTTLVNNNPAGHLSFASGAGSGYANIVLDDHVAIESDNGRLFSVADMGAQMTNWRAAGAWLANIYFAGFGNATADGKGNTFGPFVAHSGNQTGFQFDGVTSVDLRNIIISSILVFRQTGSGFSTQTGGHANIVIQKLVEYGCTPGLDFRSSSAFVFNDLELYNDNVFNTNANPWNFTSNGPNFQDIRVDKAVFGISPDSGVLSHQATTQTIILDGNASSPAHLLRLIINNASIADSHFPWTSGNENLMAPTSYLAMERYNRTAGLHRTYTPFGNLFIETTTVDVSPSLKLTPNTTSLLKLDTAASRRGCGMLAPVNNGDTLTVSVKVEEDGSYNGSAPRLIQKANSALGFDNDVVIATFSGATGSFQTLSGTTGAATDDGVLEFVVDCDGTAGNIYVDTWTVTAP